MSSDSRVSGSGVSNAVRVGSVLGVASATAVAFSAGGTASAGDPVQERCIDVIGDPSNDDSATWDLETWQTFFSTCEADFGEGKLIVDVVTDEGVAVPDTVDLDAIVDAFDFGYADPDHDAEKARFDPYCDLRWEDGGRADLEIFAYDDFRMDEDVAGRRVRVLQLLGDRDDPSGDGMTEYDIQLNELMFSWFCNADTDQLRMLGVDDVGGGYQLLPGVNPTFTAFELEVFDPITRVQVVVTPIPVETTTTTSTTTTTTTTTTTSVVPDSTTTTVVDSTTTVAPVTTPAPTTPPLAPVLPGTGRSGTTAAIAALMMAAGLGVTLLARRRPS